MIIRCQKCLSRNNLQCQSCFTNAIQPKIQYYNELKNNIYDLQNQINCKYSELTKTQIQSITHQQSKYLQLAKKKTIINQINHMRELIEEKKNRRNKYEKKIMKNKQINKQLMNQNYKIMNQSLIVQKKNQLLEKQNQNLLQHCKNRKYYITEICLLVIQHYRPIVEGRLYLGYTQQLQDHVNLEMSYLELKPIKTVRVSFEQPNMVNEQQYNTIFDITHQIHKVDNDQTYQGMEKRVINSVYNESVVYYHNQDTSISCCKDKTSYNGISKLEVQAMRKLISTFYIITKMYRLWIPYPLHLEHKTNSIKVGGQDLLLNSEQFKDHQLNLDYLNMLQANMKYLYCRMGLPQCPIVFLEQRFIKKLNMLPLNGQTLDNDLEIAELDAAKFYEYKLLLLSQAELVKQQDKINKKNIDDDGELPITLNEIKSEDDQQWIELQEEQI